MKKLQVTYWLNLVCAYAVQMVSSKFCVFCGRTPSHKTREHLIPQWLLKHTGDPNRSAYFGRDWLSPKLNKRVYSWSAFTFPACDECNNQWSQLEARVQEIILHMLDGTLVSANDLHVLMDWFDKVRIGLWLGMIYLNKNYRGIIPQFYITERIAQKDRILIIFESHERDQGIGLSGCDTPIFHKMPSMCQVVINHLHFVTASTDFLLAKRFGWPYVAEKRLVDINTDGFEARFAQGTNSIQSPIIDNLPSLDGRVILQPIAHQYAREHYPNLFDEFYGNEHIINSSREPNKGIGHVFIDNVAPTPYPDKPSDLWRPRCSYSKLLLMQRIDLWVATFQRRLFLNVPDYSHFSKKDREIREAEIKGIVAIQDRIIEHIRKGGH